MTAVSMQLFQLLDKTGVSLDDQLKEVMRIYVQAIIEAEATNGRGRTIRSEAGSGDPARWLPRTPVEDSFGRQPWACLSSANGVFSHRLWGHDRYLAGSAGQRHIRRI